LPLSERTSVRFPEPPLFCSSVPLCESRIGRGANIAIQVGVAPAISLVIVTSISQWTIQMANAKYRNDGHCVFHIACDLLLRTRGGGWRWYAAVRWVRKWTHSTQSIIGRLVGRARRKLRSTLLRNRDKKWYEHKKFRNESSKILCAIKS
jgi:hypothetical protein